MSTGDLQGVIELALREPVRFTARRSLAEPAVAWQARAVAAALREHGLLGGMAGPGRVFPQVGQARAGPGRWGWRGWRGVLRGTVAGP